MANAYTIKTTPELTDSVTISDAAGAIFKATLGSLPGTSSAVGGYVEPPVYSDSDGIKGQYSFDEEYVYMCIEDNSWDRFPVTWDAWGTAMPENPVVLSTVIDVSGATLTINFDRNVFQGSAYLDSDFNLDASIGGEDIGITYQSGDGTMAHIYSISTVIREGETVDIDYSGRASGLEDEDGNDLLSISSMSVTNLSEDLYSDIVLWSGLDGTIVGSTYTATTTDFPASHTAPVTGPSTLVIDIVNVGWSAFRRETISGQPMPSIKFAIPPNGPFRVGVWHYRSSGLNHAALAIKSSSDDAQKIRVVLSSQTSLRLAGLSGNTGWSILVDTAATLTYGTWIFFELSLDMATKTIKVYVNGSLMITYVDTGSVPSNPYDVLSLEEVNTIGLIDHNDNLMVSSDINRDLYAISLLEAYPG